MKHPFKIIRGGQAEPTPSVPTKFAQIDNRRAIIEQIKANHIACRNRAILSERAKQLNQLQAVYQHEGALDIVI